MFTVRQYLDKHFKLSGLGKAQDSLDKKMVAVVGFLVFFCGFLCLFF